MAQQTYTEEIISLVKTGFRQVAKYFTAYTYLDFTDDDIPNVRAVNQLIDIAVGDAVVMPDLLFTIPIGTASPYYFEMGAYVDYGLRPWVQKAIKDVGTDGSRLRDFTDIEHDYIYVDGALSQIEINGHLDDDGLFAEDTYITIKQNSPVEEITPDGVTFYKLKNETTFDLKYWNNDPVTNPTGDPALASVATVSPGEYINSYLGVIGNPDTPDNAYFSGADDRVIDIWFNGVLTDSAVSIHDLVVFLTQAGPAVGGNYWVVKEH